MMLWIWHGFRSQLETAVSQGDRVRQLREVLTPLESVAHVLLTLVEAEFHPSPDGCTNYLQSALETRSYRFIFSTAGVRAIQPEASRDVLISRKYKTPLLGQGL